MKRYKELKFEDKTYTEPYKINEILVKNKFEWFLDCEVENVRIEILKNTLVFNSGVFFNGTWVYGVFRDGQWKYGTWEGGVWYNGTWENGIFKNGLIFGGEFGGGKIEGGEIRGGNFLNVVIKDEVLINIAQPSKYSPKPQQGHPQNRGTEEKVEGQVQKVQPEKIEEKIVKKYELFINEKKDYDDFGKKLLNFILKKDLKIIKDYQDAGYIKRTVYDIKLENDLDPYGEEEWDLNVNGLTNIKILKNNSIFNKYEIYLNKEEIVEINSNLKKKIFQAVKNKYIENNRNRLNGLLKENMKQDKLFKEIEEYERINKIKRNQHGVEDGMGNFLPNEVFTTSEQTDIWEMIEDGWTKEEIIDRIKKW